MDEDRDRIKVARVRQGSSGLPTIVAVLVVVGIVVSLWKPWDAGIGSGPGAASPGGSGLGAGVPSPVLASHAIPTAVVLAAPTPDPLAVPCISRSGWRIVTIERTSGRESRSWVAVEPAAATSPIDRAIPVLRQVSGLIRALGYCLPIDLAVNTDPVDLVARFWRLDSTRARATDLGTLIRVAEPTVDSSDLYLAPGARAIGTSRWAAGQYVIRVADAPDAWEVWFGLELVQAPGSAQP